MSQNFVSISAVSTAKQVQDIANISKEIAVPAPVVIGYQVSHKSINHGTQNSRQPSFSELRQLDTLTKEQGMVPAIHYFTKDNSTILQDLQRIVDEGIPPGLLQYNTLPANPCVLEQAQEMGYTNIFKVAVSNKSTTHGGYAVWKGQSVQDVSKGQVDPLIEQVAARSHAITYVMFDPSHGTNLNLDLDEDSLAVRFGKRITDDPAFDHLQLVFAGGINPTNVGKVASALNQWFPGRVSSDAESGLRTEDVLDEELVRDYLIAHSNAV